MSNLDLERAIWESEHNHRLFGYKFEGYEKKAYALLLLNVTYIIYLYFVSYKKQDTFDSIH